MIVALRALRNGAGDETREIVDRALAKLEAAAAQGSGGAVGARIDPGDEPEAPALAKLRHQLQDAVSRQRQVPPDLLRARRATRCPSGSSTPAES